MKVLHVPFRYYPDPVGGTEVYVEQLCHALARRGVSSLIAIAADRTERTERAGIPVYRFAEPPRADVRSLYTITDGAEEAFFRIVDQEQPDVVHLHTSTRLTSPQAVQALHRRGIPVVFTYHLPTASCQRGTLMRWGREACDGRLDGGLCTRCTLQGLGAPRPVAEIVGRLPAKAGGAVGSLGLTGDLWTALRMRELVGLRLATTRGFFSEVDQIVVLAEWAREVLLINDVAPEKILLSRHGIEDVGSSHDSQAPQVPPPPPLRLAFLGRIGPAKGPDILVDALRLLPHGQITLGLYGITQDTSAQSSLTDLVRRAQGDVRVRFHPPVPQEEVTPLLRHYHMLAVPSRWLETGPLVILEAFAAGIPVLGMDRGGIAELVQDGVNGLLVRDESPETWRDVILRLIESPDLVCRLRAGIRVPRSVDTVAEEMDALYRSLRSGTPVKR